jgi:spore germination protein KC
MTRRATRALFLLALLAVAALPAGGCWDAVDLKDRALVFGVAIDRAPDGRLVTTMQVSQPAMGGQTRPTIFPGAARNVTVVTPTLNEVVPLVQSMLSQAVLLSHLRAIILGEELARDAGLAELVLETLMRSPSADDSAFLLVAHGRAQDILEVPTQPFPALFLNDMFDNAGQSLPVPRLALWEMLRAIEMPGREACAPGVRVAGTTIQVTGTAVFDGFHMVGWLDDVETRGLLWMLGRGTGLSFSLPTPAGQAGVQAVRTRVMLRPRTDGGRPAMDVTARLVGVVFRKPPRMRTITSRDFALIRRYTELEVERVMKRALDALQKRLMSDVVGMGRVFYYRRPALWEKLNWQEDFPRLPVRLRARVTLERKGLLR